MLDVLLTADLVEVVDAVHLEHEHEHVHHHRLAPARSDVCPIAPPSAVRPFNMELDAGGRFLLMPRFC